MYRKISRDVKIAAINLYEHGALSLDEILDCVGFSERTFWRILKLWRETGDVVRHNYGLPGRPRSFKFDDIDYILRLLRFRPDWFLDELLDLLKHNRLLSSNFATIYSALQATNVSRKKLKVIARERNEPRRQAFREMMKKYSPDEIGFIDETSKNDRTAARRYGRARRGKRAEMKQRFVRGRRLTAEALLTVNGIIATKVVEGSMTRDLYVDWLEKSVVRPLLEFMRVQYLRLCKDA